MSDPEDASQWQAEDVISRGYKHDPQFLKLVETTRPVDEIDPDRVDAIVIVGGQGPMFTFEAATNLHAKFTELYEARRICAALCHGVGLLRYARLSNGEPLVAGKTVTGFANVEEDFVDRAVGQKVMPYRIEDELRKRGANYTQGGLLKAFAVRDGRLITGQQQYSGAKVAQQVIAALGT